MAGLDGHRQRLWPQAIMHCPQRKVSVHICGVWLLKYVRGMIWYELETWWNRDYRPALPDALIFTPRH